VVVLSPVVIVRVQVYVQCVKERVEVFLIDAQDVKVRDDAAYVKVGKSVLLAVETENIETSDSSRTAGFRGLPTLVIGRGWEVTFPTFPIVNGNPPSQPISAEPPPGLRIRISRVASAVWLVAYPAMWLRMLAVLAEMEAKKEYEALLGELGKLHHRHAKTDPPPEPTRAPRREG